MNGYVNADSQNRMKFGQSAVIARVFLRRCERLRNAAHVTRDKLRKIINFRNASPHSP